MSKVKGAVCSGYLTARLMAGSAVLALLPVNAYAQFQSIIDLSSLDGTSGIRLDGAQDIRAGISVANAGDINGDGYGDVIVGTQDKLAFVVFGKENGIVSPVDLTALNGADGFRIEASDTSEDFGKSVSGVDDVNGDGFDDIVIGAPGSAPNGAGAAYVVFGKSSDFPPVLTASAIKGNIGFRIQGLGTAGKLGASVASAGDVNGDGYSDIVIGASDVSFGSLTDIPGAAFVVFGKAALLVRFFSLRR